MRTLPLLPTLVAALLCCAVAGQTAVAALPEESETWRQKVDDLAQPLIDDQRAVGLAVGLVAPDGRREFYAYGKTRADGPPPNAKTLFEIGSVTKTFTALLLALAAERGEVKLDDPVRLYVPPPFVMPRRGAQEITLVELATHTSGLPENPPNLLQAIIKDPRLNDNPFLKFDNEQLVACLAGITLKAEPPPKVAYSNLGMGLLGDALARHAGVTYAELLRARITAPLGMKDTLLGAGHSRAKDMATGHGPKQSPLPCWDFASLPGCGAICSNVDDMLTYVEAQTGRKATPLAAAIDATQERRQPAFVVMSVGLGWFLQKIAGQQAWWHNGGTGGYSSFVAFSRDPAVAVVVLCNSGPEAVGAGAPVDEIGRRLLKQLIESAGKAK